MSCKHIWHECVVKGPKPPIWNEEFMGVPINNIIYSRGKYCVSCKQVVILEFSGEDDRKRYPDLPVVERDSGRCVS